jgi:hypothetical protein
MAMRTPVILDVNPTPEDLRWESGWLKSTLDLPVVTCAGPHEVRDCPLLKGERCGKVARADGILFQLDLDREDHREILEIYADSVEVPVRAVVTKEQQERYPELLQKVEVVNPPIGPAALDAFAAEVQAEIG